MNKLFLLLSVIFASLFVIQNASAISTAWVYDDNAYDWACNSGYTNINNNPTVSPWSVGLDGNSPEYCDFWFHVPANETPCISPTGDSCPNVFVDLQNINVNYYQNLTNGIPPECIVNGSLHIRIAFDAITVDPCDPDDPPNILYGGKATISCFHNVNDTIDARDISTVSVCTSSYSPDPSYPYEISPNGAGLAIWFNEILPQSINVTIDSPTNTTYNSKTISVIVEANITDVNSWWYSLNGGANITFSPNTTITADEGANALVIYANDTLGEEGAAEVYFSVDSTRPEITISSPTNTTYAINSTALNVTANKTIDTWWYSLNGGTNTTFIPNIIITSANGTNTLKVYANDSLGNLAEKDVSYTVTITPPIPPTPPSPPLSPDIPIATKYILATILGAGALLIFAGMAMSGEMTVRNLVVGMIFLVIAITLAATFFAL